MASSNIINALTSILEREEGPFISKEKILSLLRKKQLDEEEKLPNQPELPDEGDADLINRNNKVLWSIKEVTITIQDEDTEDSTDAAGDGSDRPKKKKSRKEHLLSKKNRNDPNAPALNRIPLPELRDSEKIDKQQAIREVSKRLKLGPETLPSVCFYTLLNGHHHHNSAALCAEISEDSRLMAAGFSDSSIRVWALAEEKLKGMRTANELETLDKESDDVTIRMMDTTSTDVKILRGHNGPVYNVSFSLDRTLLLSCSEDSTVRLWSLQTWTNICCYKGHLSPVWDVKFSPHGYYFATSSFDHTARLWATDNHQPLRLFVGHYADVDCVQFHPNSNYIATGSSDFSVRLWDVLNGQCVRYMRGHRGKIYTMIFSTCGRFLISAGGDKNIIIWDMAHGNLVAKLMAHRDTIYSLCYSRDGTVLASGGADDCVNIWDFKRLIQEADLEEIYSSRNPIIRTQNDSVLLGSYRTKSTNILTLHFSRRNLLLAAGIFH